MKVTIDYSSWSPLSATLKTVYVLAPQIVWSLTAVPAVSVSSAKVKVSIKPAYTDTSGTLRSVRVVVKQGSVTVTVNSISLEYVTPVPE